MLYHLLCIFGVNFNIESGLRRHFVLDILLRLIHVILCFCQQINQTISFRLFNVLNVFIGGAFGNG